MKFLIYIICILCGIICAAVCDDVNQNNEKNVFVLIGIDYNQINQLIKTCLIEDPNALRILVVDEDGLHNDNTKHLGMSHWFSNGLELLKSKKLHNGQIGQVLLDSRHGGWPFQFSGGDNNIIHYRYHEFGYFEFQQDQKIIVNGDYMLWPGFSNQPSFWNVGKIKKKRLYFNIDDPLFEQVFSLQYYQRGLRVVCLDYETTYHIGDDVSAYALNNEVLRYWDATD